ncbi:hypothetical protein AB0B25_06595 [Nocardia sp. NPDC049190]|uniref:hypothetical protein n=1 Tax=Nocardia sp. NPDC049190 TaxID=3155650 RepID=UPI00340E2B48
MAERRVEVKRAGLPIDQVRRNFDFSLAGALEGQTPCCRTGLGPHVEDALIAMVLAYPSAGEELIANTRREFAREVARREHDRG